MGNLLGAPVTDKKTHVGKTDELEFGLSSMQGWRVHMEDAHIAEVRMYALDGERKIDLPGHSLFACFDGHGGTFAAIYSGDNFCRILSRQSMFVKYAEFCQERQSKEFANDSEKAQYLRTGVEYLEAALKSAFVDVDQEISMAIRGTPHPNASKPYHEPEKKNDATNEQNTTMTDAMAAAQQFAANQASALNDDGDSGTTAVCVLVTPDWFVCANAGDSRAVYSKNQRPIPLSYDHKPDDEEEERRIRAAGGYVAGGRVEGDLAVSRGFGDFRFKHMPTVAAGNDTNAAGIMSPGDQKVSPVPDIIVQNRNAEQDEFIIVACDGIWDVRSNLECVQEVAAIFKEGEGNLGLVCEELLDVCLRLGSKDNMTALVVKFKAQTIGQGGGVSARRKEREESMKDDDGGSQRAEGDEDATPEDADGAKSS